MADLLERARRLGHERFAAIAAEGEPGRLNRPLVKALGDEGLLSSSSPARPRSSASAARGRPRLHEAETALALQGLGGYPILRAAKPELRDRWIPKLSAGRPSRRSRSASPTASSDAAAGAPGGGGRRRLPPDRHEALDLERAEADVYSVFAHLRRRREGHHACDPARARGSRRASSSSPPPIGRLDFDGVPAGPEQVLGEVGGGFAVAMDTLDLFRPSVGAFGVGMAQAALDAAVRYTSERGAFGSRSRASRRSATSSPRSRRRSRPRGCSSATRRASTTRACGRCARRRRWRSSSRPRRRSAPWTSRSRCTAQGPREGHLLEHLYREVRAPRIYEGASEVQREIIARELYKEAQRARTSRSTTSYLALEEILGAQRPRSDEHDEVLSSSSTRSTSSGSSS